jgi:hypothetical protein
MDRAAYVGAASVRLQITTTAQRLLHTAATFAAFTAAGNYEKSVAHRVHKKLTALHGGMNRVM